MRTLARARRPRAIKRESNPAAGFYADDHFEYDIRHFVGAASRRVRIDKILGELNRAALRDELPPWDVAFANLSETGSFYVLRRPVVRGKD